jgi:flagellar hook-basal body protein
MSFYTSLTGLNAASAQLSVTSNNIANVGTTGFKRSRADFGDIFATSPLQKASSVIGQGTALKQVSQEFSQGNIQFSANSLDIAITGDGFFPLKSADGLQDIYTRNGTFMLNDSYTVVNAAGQALISASVDSSGKADLENLSKLIIPRSTTGDAVATSDIELALNLPADAKIPVLPFDKNDPTTYNKTTAITVYDAGGNDYLATVYYRKTQVARPEDPSNKWQTYVYIGEQKLQELLIQSKDKSGELQYVNKYGEVRPESEIPPQDIARGVTKLFNLDDLQNPIASTPATASSASSLPTSLVNEWKSGIDFPDRIGAWVNDNSTAGAVFENVSAQSYTLHTRSKISVDENNETVFKTATTKLVFEPEERGNIMKLTIGDDIYVGSDLNDLEAKILAGGKYVADNLAGKFTVQLDDDPLDPTSIDPDATFEALTAESLPSEDFEETLTSGKITRLDVTIADTADGHVFKIGNESYSGATLADLVVAINAKNQFDASYDTPEAGKLTVQIKTGGPSEINSNYSFTTGTAAGEPIEPTASAKKITEVTFAVAPGTGPADPGMQDLMLKIGNSTYTGATVQEITDNINKDGKYVATLDETAGLLVISLTGNTGDPTLINENYKLTHVTSELQADTLDALADEINIDSTLQYEASINAAGNLVLKPKDGVTPYEIPEFSMVSSFGDDHELRPDSKTNTTIKYTVPYLSDNFTLDLDTRYVGTTVDQLVDDINGVSSYVADPTDFATTVVGSDITKLEVTVLSGAKDFALVIGDLTGTSAGKQFSGYDLTSLVESINSDGTYTAAIVSGKISITPKAPTTTVDSTYSLEYQVKDSNRTFDATTSSNSDGSVSITITAFGAGITMPAASSLTVASLGLSSGADDLVFDINVDQSATPISVDLSYLKDLSATRKFTGIEIARELTNAINKSYGDQRYFDFSSFKSSESDTAANIFRLTVGDISKPIALTEGQFGIKPYNDVDGTGGLKEVTLDQAIYALQAVIDKEIDFPAKVTVGYDPVRQSFTFKTDEDVDVSIRSYTTSKNELFGLTDVASKIDPATGTWGNVVLPNGTQIVNAEDQRFGVKVKFDETKGVFSISSGTTGDTSSITISKASALANYLFGFVQGEKPTKVDTSPVPLRGINSSPAVLTGNSIGINLDNKFRVDGSNNQFVVTVDNVTGLILMPEKSDYTMEEFRQELETRINALADNFGRTVNGLKLDIVTNPSTNKKNFVFTTGTSGNDSFLKVSANSIWGLDGLPSARGSTSLWIQPPQAKNTDGFPLYVDRDGMETSDPGDFSEDETRDLWSPIFLDKGELTFDTGGNLKSPVESIRFKSTTIGDSGATLQFAINYDASTQYSSPFSVLKQDQNGRPEGDLIGVDIGDDGLVSASYSNGSQKSLAKIVLVNFAAPTGLRQIGDASYYATSKSGDAKYGEAGSAGFGTVRAGARERANVDLTNELVELITAQRNFQANAKAIETNNTLTQAIINIRS